MRRLATVGLVAGAALLVLPTTAAPAAAMPPPCPVQPLVHVSPDAVVIHVGCLAPIVVPIPPVTR